MDVERETISKWIEGEEFVVRVEVPVEVPLVPRLGAEAVKFLERVRELADWGEVGELEKLGEVYVRRAG